MKDLWNVGQQRIIYRFSEHDLHARRSCINLHEIDAFSCIALKFPWVTIILQWNDIMYTIFYQPEHVFIMSVYYVSFLYMLLCLYSNDSDDWRSKSSRYWVKLSSEKVGRQQKACFNCPTTISVAFCELTSWTTSPAITFTAT